MRVKQSIRWASIGLLLASSSLVASACGSGDNKKKPGPRFQDGGESSGGGSSSSTPSEGGRSEPGEGGGGTSEAGAAQGASAGSAGSAQGGMVSAAGESGSSGGAVGSADLCPTGTADCDDDASTCEDVNNLLQCGSCDVSCSDENGTVECQEGTCVMTSCTSGFGDCDVDGTTGCEESLTENDERCGSCTRDCAAAGSTCSTSMCAAVVFRASASGFASVLAHDNIYIANGGSMGSTGAGNWTLDRMPLDKSGRFSVWAGTATFASGALWADETHVYWATAGTPSSVLRKAADAASDALPEVVYQPPQQPSYFRGQGANFYWAANSTGFIYARSKSAPMDNVGVAIMSVDQGNYLGFVTTPTMLYWIGNEGGASVRMVPIAGGEPTPVPGAVIHGAGAPMWAHGETLYFVRRDGTNALNGIYKYTAGDASATQLVASDTIFDVIVDDTGIYYKSGTLKRLYKVALTGGVGVPIATGVSDARFTGIDDTFVYQIHSWGSNGNTLAMLK